MIPTLLFFSFLLIFLYNLLFRRRHGRLPPGPKPWPVVGSLPHLGAAPHHSLAALAKVHGPLMHLRLGSVHVVVASSASVAAEFLKTHDANFASRPSNSSTKHIFYNHQDMAFAPYGPRWRMLRKLCQEQLFSTMALDKLIRVRQEEVGIMTGALAKVKSAAQVGQILNVCVTNATSRVVLGRRVFGDGSGKEDPKAEEFKAMVVEVMELTGMFNIGDYIPVLEWFDLQGIAKRMKKVHKRFDGFVGQILKEQYEAQLDQSSNRHRSDLLTTVLTLKDDCDGEGGKLSDLEIKALLMDLFIGGTNTSLSTIDWAIAELVRNPKVMARVQEELDSVVGRDRVVTESDLSTLTYFQAVIKEVFRLHPAIPLLLPRIAAENCEINGYSIPKNTTILVNMWAIARDPGTWDSPLEFRPDRFLPGGERPLVDVKGNDFQLIPFGAGRRICPGTSLGLRMVQFITATLAHGFDWEVADRQRPDELNMEEAYGLTLQRKVPLMVYPRPRLSSHAYDLN